MNAAVFGRFVGLALMMMMGLAACSAPVDSASDPTSPNSTVGTMVGAATDGPGVSVLTPLIGTSVAYDPAGTSVLMKVTTNGADLGETHELAWSLDGAKVAQGSDPSHLFTGAPAGKRHIAARPWLAVKPARRGATCGLRQVAPNPEDTASFGKTLSLLWTDP